MCAAPSPQRAEPRIPMRMFVKLSDPSTNTFELSATVDISCHGARVETKKCWQIGEQLSVRSIRGNLFSIARVAYCQPQVGKAYVMGLDFLRPTGDWARSA